MNFTDHLKSPRWIELTWRSSLAVALGLAATSQRLPAEESPTGLAITHNNYGRAVSGSTHEVGFTLSNFDQEEISFTLSAIGNATGSEPTGFEGVSSPIGPGIPVTQQPYLFNADTSGLAGSVISVGMTATEDAPGTRTASSSFDLRLLENRTIGFSLQRVDGSVSSAEGTLDLGRFIGNRANFSYNSDTGQFTHSSTGLEHQQLRLGFDGGSQSRELATDVGWNPALISNPYGADFDDTSGATAGLRYSKSHPDGNSATRNFNGTDISHSVDLRFTPGSGAISKTIDFATPGHLAEAFTPESVSGSAISGAQVQFSGSEITIQGNSLSNRTIFASSDSGNGLTTNEVNLSHNDRSSTARAGGLFDTDSETAGVQGRVMVGSSGNIAAGTDTWNIASPGLDDSTARVNFTGSGVMTSGFLAVDTGSAEETTLFDGTGSRQITASWGSIAYGTEQGVGINTSNSGVRTSLVNLSGNLSSGEEGGPIAGQRLGNLSIGYSLEVVDDRPLSINDVNRTAFHGSSVDSLSNTLTGTRGNYTNPTVANSEGNSKVITNTSWTFKDTIPNSLGLNDAGSGTRTLTITPEGLEGERGAYTESYNWSLSRVHKAEVATSGNLSSESSQTQINSGRYDHTFSRGETVEGKVSLGSFTLAQTNAGQTDTANASIDSWVSYKSRGFSNEVASTDSGRSKTFDFSFDDTGLSNGTYFSSVTIEAEHADRSIIGSDFGDLGVYTHLFEVVVSGRVDNTGYKGFRRTQFDSTSAQVSEGDTALQILDIVDTGGESGISMEILAENGQVVGPDGQPIGFTSGEITGLEGIKFVLQSTYDKAELVNNFGTDTVAALLWRNERGEFVNAVLGNNGDAEMGGLEGQPKVGQRFVGSYADYLASLGENVDPRLGDYGYDPENSHVWAVIDHNSEFGGAGAVAAGVPEPSSFALLLLASSAFVWRRRRNSN